MSTRAPGRGIGMAGVFNAGVLPVARFERLLHSALLSEIQGESCRLDVEGVPVLLVPDIGEALEEEQGEDVLLVVAGVLTGMATVRGWLRWSCRVCFSPNQNWEWKRERKHGHTCNLLILKGLRNTDRVRYGTHASVAERPSARTPSNAVDDGAPHSPKHAYDFQTNES